MDNMWLIIMVFVILLALGVQIHEIRSFRKWLETRWYSDLKEKQDE